MELFHDIIDLSKTGYVKINYSEEDLESPKFPDCIKNFVIELVPEEQLNGTITLEKVIDTTYKVVTSKGFKILVTLGSAGIKLAKAIKS